MTEATESAVEQEIQAKGLNAPRLSPQHIDRLVERSPRLYHRFEGTTTTVCCLVLPNGFTVIGKSAAASPENFDAEIGQKIALNDARSQLWALEGYLLRQRLHEDLSRERGGAFDHADYR